MDPKVIVIAVYFPAADSSPPQQWQPVICGRDHTLLPASGGEQHDVVLLPSCNNARTCLNWSLLAPIWESAWASPAAASEAVWLWTDMFPVKEFMM